MSWKGKSVQGNVAINQKLVQCWYTKDVIDVLKVHLDEFNLINCTTALHRLGKATKGAPQQLGQWEQKLLEHTVEHVQSAGDRCPPQNLANALWACEKLHVKDGKELQALLGAAREAVSDTKRLPKFTGQQLANVIWAASKLGATRDFGAFETAAAKRAKDLNGQELSMVAWALSTSSSNESATKAAMGAVVTATKHIPGGVETLVAQQLSTISWAMSKAGCHDVQFLKEIARVAHPRVTAGQFNCQDLANIVWAFGRVEVLSEDLFESVAKQVKNALSAGNQGRGSNGRFSPQHLSMIAWAFAKVNMKHLPLMNAIVNESQDRLREISPRDLTDIVWSVAQLKVKCPKFISAAGEQSVKLLDRFNSQELMRFMAAFKRAGGETGVHSKLMAVQRELQYEFPGIEKPIVLASETPGERLKHDQRNKEIGGDPQRSDGRATGVALWEASFVLAEWLARQKGGLWDSDLPSLLPRRCRLRDWTKASVVELGAGLGLPSIVASHHGATVVATDGDSTVLRLLKTNVERNLPKAARGAKKLLRASQLLWGDSDAITKLGLKGRPDVVLAADVVYASSSEELSTKLIDTMLNLSGPNTLLIMSNIMRFPHGHKQGEEGFFDACAKRFDICSLPRHVLHSDFQRSGVGGCSVRLLWRKGKGGATPTEAGTAFQKTSKKVKVKKRKSPKASARTLEVASPSPGDRVLAPKPRKSKQRARLERGQVLAENNLEEIVPKPKKRKKAKKHVSNAMGEDIGQTKRKQRQSSGSDDLASAKSMPPRQKNAKRRKRNA
mmetsp:Transcript_23181/g.50884  ORF Transcript_23181/g.50884 Transcript_23181/m.50884 type:complete len:785 (-) Transcript_23181:87-2441(-)